MSLRNTARAFFARALAEASVERAFARQVRREGDVLCLGAEDAERIDLRGFARVAVVSLGKAGHAMAAAFVQCAGELPQGALTGIIADPQVPASPLTGFQYFRGGHPAPNAESVAAANAILTLARAADERTLLVCLVSGGGSSVVETPLAAIALEDLTATYRALVLCGAPIEQINAVRKHLSAIKGGRLAQAAGGARLVSLLISDVPDGATDALASGPTVPDHSTVEDVYRIAAEHDLLPRLPEATRRMFEQRQLVETPKPGDACFARASFHTLLSNQTAREGAAAAAREAGYAVVEDNSCDDWDYELAAEYLLGRLRALRQQRGRVCLISGGEVTVKVTGSAGTGGRNQQFALACAALIAGEHICVLSAGTDGVDGNSPAAGAVVDGSTLSRARAHGLRVEEALARFDAHPLLAALGDDVVTGSTGNNVRDVRILLAG